MSKKYRLCYYRTGKESLREKYYPSFLDAKTNIPCKFEFKTDGVHNNKEHYRIIEEGADSTNVKINIIQTYIYIKSE
ncbi:MAG: hypothetical protein QNK33_05285 [Bacteroidales bacterium]|nr:hypothetical protein [Bacteroidales bacterium]